MHGHTASHKTFNPFTLLVLSGLGLHRVLEKLLKPLKINLNAVKRQKKHAFQEFIFEIIKQQNK